MYRFTLLAMLSLIACTGRTEAPPAPQNKAQALVDAARADDTTQVASLLADGISPDTMAPDGTRPLAEAARNGRVATAHQLLAADAKVDLPDSSGLRPWDYALSEGKEKIVAELAWQAAQVAGVSQGGREWFDGVAAGSSALPEWHKVFDGELESIALIFAIAHGRPDIVSAMRHGAGIPNRTGITPLAIAARFGATSSVTALLQAGANPDLATKDRWESTPLMEAARDGYVEIGRALLHAGARIDHRDISGGTALHWAVRGGTTAYARMLLENRADPNIPEWTGETPLAIARRINHTDLISLFESWPGVRRE